MGAKFTIVVEGGDVGSDEAKSVLETVPDIKVTTVEERIVGAMASKFLIELAGRSVDKIADHLIRQREKKLGGSTVFVKSGPTTIKLTGANRGDLIALLNQISEMTDKPGG